MKSGLRYLLVILLSMLLLPWARVKAQYYHSGQAPASVSWLQIKHPRLRLVFPEKMQDQALGLLKSMDTLMPAVSVGLDHYPRKVPLILYNTGIVSNGLTAWAPRRMEFYTTPPQDHYAQDWLSQLFIHEYRHVVQIDKLNTGLTKTLGWFLGEQITAVVLGLYVPLWFMEGDAVVAETAISQAGRGREPSFSAPLRAQLHRKGIYDYEKAIFGSYRDFTPNAYILGYHLTAYGVQQFGQEPWQLALERTGRRPWSITPFSSGFKKGSGFSSSAWYRHALTQLDSLWQNQSPELNPALTALLLKEPDGYSEFHHPQPSSQGMIISERYSIDDIDRIVGIDSMGKIQVIATPGLLMRGSLNVRENHILWAEYRFDPRWEQRSWSAFIHLDQEKGVKRILTHGRRLFSPALSPDLQQVVAVETHEIGNASLVMLRMSDGKQISEWTAPEFSHLMQPAWFEDGRHLIFLAQELSGLKHLVMLDWQTRKYRSILGPLATSIHHPIPDGSGVWFTGDAMGEEAIFWVDTLDGIPLWAVSSKFGLAEAFPDGKGKLLASNYTPDGYRPVQIRIDSIQKRTSPLPSGLQYDIIHSWPDLAKRSFPGDTSWVPEVSRYRRFRNLFHFHSWAPAYIDADSRSLGPGFSIMSQDVLNTSFLTAGYHYNYSEDFGEWQIQYRYEGWYPKLSATVKTSERTAYKTTVDEQRIRYDWSEYELESAISLPLNWMIGKYWTGILPQVTISRLWLEMHSDSPFQFKHKHLGTTNYRLLAYRLHKQSHRDLQPPWGQVIDLRYRHDPFLSAAGDIKAAIGTLYFPGLLPHHGIMVSAGHQLKSQGEYYYSGMVRYPTGTIGHGEQELSSLVLLYRLPLLLPDFNIPRILYIKRIKGGVFHEWAKGKTGVLERRYRTAGGEIRFDMHLFRFIAPVDIGGRLARDLERSRWAGEFLLTIHFSDL